MIETADMKQRVSGYMTGDGSANTTFMHSIKKALHEGKLDHNYIRKAVINCFKSHDEKAIILGSLLLQLDNDEIYELLKDEQISI